MAAFDAETTIASGHVGLRPVHLDDLDTFYAFECEPMTRRMLGYSAEEELTKEAFLQRWLNLLGNPEVSYWTILHAADAEAEPCIVGNASTFYRPPSRVREVGYIIGKEYWGQGIATAALGLVIGLAPERPLSALCAEDNAASIRVLVKQGFRLKIERYESINPRGDKVISKYFELA